jgi:predicted nucleotidyltransferase
MAEPKYNPFDAPVPGQSLTDTPSNAPWENPPQMTNIHEMSLFMFKQLTSPILAEQIILMLKEGIPVEAIARVILFGGFVEGKWTVDSALLIAKPIVQIITAVAVKGGLKEFKLSLEDRTNLKFRRNLADMKVKIEKTAKDLSKSMASMSREKQKMPEQTVEGLMSSPTQQEVA